MSYHTRKPQVKHAITIVCIFIHNATKTAEQDLGRLVILTTCTFIIRNASLFIKYMSFSFGKYDQTQYGKVWGRWVWWHCGTVSCFNPLLDTLLDLNREFIDSVTLPFDKFDSWGVNGTSLLEVTNYATDTQFNELRFNNLIICYAYRFCCQIWSSNRVSHMTFYYWFQIKWRLCRQSSPTRSGLSGQ